MVPVTVDGPLREHHIGAFRSQNASEVLIVRLIDDGAAIVLSGESGTGLENLAGFPGFCGADIGTAAEAGSAAKPFAAVEVQQNHLMAECRVACDGPGA